MSFSYTAPTKKKAPATISEQLLKLKERGLIIDDETKAYATLETINYYRLVHYFAVFLDESGEYYKAGTRFSDAIRLYDFDRRIRTEILVALEEIEIAARAAISNYHAVTYQADGYLRESSFDRRHNHRMFRQKIDRMLDKNSDLSFVRHHNDKYGGRLPLWVMMEMFSFGMLVFFYQDLKKEDKKAIANHYFDLDYRFVDNWLENLADLRNHCAHYNRVYGNPLPGNLRIIEIEHPREYEMDMVSPSLFDYLIIIKLLHKRSDIKISDVTWGSKFVVFLEALFDEFSDIVKPEVMGFPTDWREFIYE
jgi:abortive infection bacteriophage resistance protein